MLCCGGKRRRKDRDVNDDDTYYMEQKPMERQPVEMDLLLKEQIKRCEQMEARVQQLESLVLEQSELLNQRQCLKDLIIKFDNQYAKQLKDIDMTQRANARYTADILKMVVVLTKYQETTFKDLPVEIKEQRETMASLVVHDWRRFGIALKIPDGVIDQIKGTNAIEHFWKVIQFRNSMEPIKVQDLQMAFFEVKKVGLENVRPMPGDHREIIEQYKDALYMVVVDAVIVLPYMRCFVYIPPETVQYIINPELKIGRMANMIDVLPTIGSDAVQVFTDALFHSGHEVLSGQIKDSVRQRGYRIEEPVPVPITEADRAFLHRRSGLERSPRVRSGLERSPRVRSGLERSPRVNEEIKEIRRTLLEKIREQLDKEETECTHF